MRIIISSSRTKSVKKFKLIFPEVGEEFEGALPALHTLHHELHLVRQVSGDRLPLVKRGVLFENPGLAGQVELGQFGHVINLQRSRNPNLGPNFGNRLSGGFIAILVETQGIGAGAGGIIDGSGGIGRAFDGEELGGSGSGSESEVMG